LTADRGILTIPRVFSDEPLKPEEEASFQFDSYAQTLAALIAYGSTHVPITIAVQGSWGMGKTTLMRKVQGILDGRMKGGQFLHCRTVWFEAWRYAKHDEMFVALTGQMLRSMRQAGVMNHVWGISDDTNTRRIEPSNSGRDGIPRLSSLSEEDIDPEAYRTSNSWQGNGFFRDDFQDTLQQLVKEFIADGRLVIFIDELDRCVPAKVVQVLEAMKLLLHSFQCVLVLGVDIDVIAEAVQAYYRAEHQEHINGREYLDKIIQLRFPLPPIRANDLESYLATLADVEETTLRSLRLITETIPTNPRRIKTFLNHVELQWAILVNGHLSQHLDKAQLVEWLILQDLKPDFCKFVNSRPTNGQRTEVFQEMKRIAEGDGNYCVADSSPLAPFARDEDLLEIVRRGQFDYTEAAFTLCAHLAPAPSLEAKAEAIEAQAEAIQAKAEAMEATGNLSTRKDIEAAVQQGRSLAMVKLRGADLLGASLQYADLRSINLGDADLRRADFWGANLEKAILQRANLQDANLQGTNLQGTNLQGANLQGANLQGANLGGANLQHSVGLSWQQVKSTISYNGALLPDYLLASIPDDVPIHKDPRLSLTGSSPF